MRVKTEARRNAIIKAAGKLFLEQGYDAVTMVKIAAEVGGSKVTLYNYFPSKESVFEAFVIEAGKANFERLLDLPDEADTVTTLKALGCNYLRLVLTPAVLDLDRLIIGEARRIPELSRIFYENGPRRTLDDMDKVFAKLIEHGGLRRCEPRLMTCHFKGLCDGGLFEQQLWGLAPTPSDKQINDAAEAAVHAFLNGYAG